MCFNLNICSIFNICFSSNKTNTNNNKNSCLNSTSLEKIKKKESTVIAIEPNANNKQNQQIITVQLSNSKSLGKINKLDQFSFDSTTIGGYYNSLQSKSSLSAAASSTTTFSNFNNNNNHRFSLDYSTHHTTFNFKTKKSNKYFNKLLSGKQSRTASTIALPPTSLSNISTKLSATKNIFVDEETFGQLEDQNLAVNRTQIVRPSRKLDTQLLINNKFCDNCLNSNKNCICNLTSYYSNTNNNNQPESSSYSINQLVSTSTTLNNFFYFDNNQFSSPSISTRSTTSTMSSADNFNKLKSFSDTFSQNNEFINKPDLLITKPTRPSLAQPFTGSILLEKPKLESLQAKKQAFYFNKTDELFSKPNKLLDEMETTNELDEKLTKMMNDEQKEAVSSTKRHPHQHHNAKHKSRGGKITIAKDQVYEFKESELKDLGQIGSGEFGIVNKVLHVPSQTFMALKRIGPTVGNQGERKKVLKELDFVMECNDYSYVVKFYGVKFNNEPADCLILMELMDTSLEKFYKYVYEEKKEEIPESILGKIVVAALNALNYLKEQYSIIHRDVKPSNMLINRHGQIKMCDFGISGKLVDSIAASRDAGCQLYMAPERIDPTLTCTQGYDVRSDVWSLGITLYELACGKFPYPQWKTIFHQLTLVVENDAPRLESERLSYEFKDFVNTCLTKDEKKRPKYKVLLQHPLIEIHTKSNVNVSEYVEPYIIEMEQQNKI